MIQVWVWCPRKIMFKIKRIRKRPTKAPTS